MRKNNALDFDDLLMLTVSFSIRTMKYWRCTGSASAYIMVDEYQEPMPPVRAGSRLLAGEHKNYLCVVGDDDQSIWNFAAPTSAIFWIFEKGCPMPWWSAWRQVTLHPEHTRHSQRSDAKTTAPAKQVPLDRPRSEPCPCPDLYIRNGKRLSRCARTSGPGPCGLKSHAATTACSTLPHQRPVRLAEERFAWVPSPTMSWAAPISITPRDRGRSCLSKTIDNGGDDIAVRRIVNVPKRGIGATTLGRAAE